jgi:ubiquitin thioesterase protein OTUB1
MRLLAAAQLKEHEEDFLPYVLGTSECASVSDYCSSCVEAVSSEADAIPIMALTAALGVATRIAYLDAAPDETHVQIVRLPEDALPGTMTLDLLYRPGHYDVAWT